MAQPSWLIEQSRRSEPRGLGDAGLRLDAGPVGTLRWWAKLLFVAALVLGFAGPAAAISGLPTLPSLDHRSVHVVGLVLAVAGIAGTLAAQLAMGSFLPSVGRYAP